MKIENKCVARNFISFFHLSPFMHSKSKKKNISKLFTSLSKFHLAAILSNPGQKRKQLRNVIYSSSTFGMHQGWSKKWHFLLFFRYFDYNRLQLEGCNTVKMNSKKTEQEEVELNLFSPDSGVFESFLGMCVLVCVCLMSIGVVLEVRRWVNTLYYFIWSFFRRTIKFRTRLSVLNFNDLSLYFLKLFLINIDNTRWSSMFLNFTLCY